MKLTVFQLEPHLKTHLAPIYVVSGEELILKQEALSLIRKAAKKSGFHERVVFQPQSATDWDALYSLLYTASLFKEKRLIELKLTDHLPNKAAAEILQAYCEKPSSDNLLLIETDKLDIKASKSLWYSACEKKGMTLTLWPIPLEQLPQWIMQRAKKYDIQFQKEALSYLVAEVEGNLIAASQLLEKIALLQHPDPIDIATLQTILSDESRFTIFDFTDSLITKNASRTLHKLHCLREDHVEPVLVLWAITKECRLLAALKAELKQGVSESSLFQKHRVFPKRQNAVWHYLKTFTEKQSLAALKQAAKIDRLIKGAVSGKVWDELELLCLRML